MPGVLRPLKIFNFYPDSGLPFCGIWPNILPGLLLFLSLSLSPFSIKELPYGLVFCCMVLFYYLAQLFLIFQNDFDISSDNISQTLTVWTKAHNYWCRMGRSTFFFKSRYLNYSFLNIALYLIYLYTHTEGKLDVPVISWNKQTNLYSLSKYTCY